MNKAIIEIKNLQKSYQVGEEDLQVLKGIDLTIHHGEFVSIMGRSGAGKSTFLQILGCLDTASSGSYCLDGEEVQGLSEDQLALRRNQKIGFVFQSFYLLSHLTVLQNVMVPMEYSGIALSQRKEIASRWLESFSMSHRLNHWPHQLSGGERQRVALARSMVNNPKVLLADEPTGNLDLKVRDEVMKILQEVNESYDLTLIMVTHDQELGNLAPRKIVLRDGRVCSASSN